MELFGVENPCFRILTDPEEIRKFKAIAPEYADNEEPDDEE